MGEMFGTLAKQYHAGGWMMHPILVALIFTLAVMIDRIIVLYFKAALDKESFLRGLKPGEMKANLGRTIDLLGPYQAAGASLYASQASSSGSAPGEDGAPSAHAEWPISLGGLMALPVPPHPSRLRVQQQVAQVKPDPQNPARGIPRTGGEIHAPARPPAGRRAPERFRAPLRPP